MRVAKSFTAGLKRVVQSPSLILWLYLTSLILVIPLTLILRGILKESIGGSLVHENLRQGFDLSWYGEFSFGSRGLADTFGPSVVGILPVLGNLEKLLEGEVLRVGATVFLFGALFLLAWAFFAGGILDCYARSDEAYSRSRFFSRSGEYFFRFVRLMVIAGVIYWVIFRWVAKPLHNWLESAIRDVTVERTAMFFTLLLYALVAFLLVLANMILDYAKIALVVEQRRSCVLAFFWGLRFVFSQPGKTFGLYLILAAVGLVLLIFYSLVAPGAGQSSWVTIGLAFLVGQACLVARLILKLWFLASQTALFQSAQAPPEAG